MPSGFVVRNNEYFDSVFLMGINKRLSAAAGVEQTAVLMGTDANKRLLAEIGIIGPEIEAAHANDLVVAVVAETMDIVRDVIESFDGILQDLATGTRTSDVHTFRAALDRKPGANLAVFSIPGEYVASEARKVLESNLNVFIFSSNVPLEQELELKQLGHDRNLLVMGPDCGTSILNGTGIGFSNAVRHGSIGAVGPSGTGLQEFTSQVHNAGAGISHAIGTGSNDLSDAIGGLTTIAALQRLEVDPQTDVIAIIAKPPGKITLAKLEAEAGNLTKPLIGCFLGMYKEADSESGVFQWASTIDDATMLALRAIGFDSAEITQDGLHDSIEDLEAVRALWSEDARYLRGIFAGGTYCYQAQHILQEAKIPVYSNGPIRAEFKLEDPDVAREHSVIDMGDEYYTLGKPHPMIDGTERGKRILREAADPSVAILLLDFILGYNASSDPVGELLDSLQRARAMRSIAGDELTIVASICGTPEDHQDIDLQVEMLKENAVVVFRSSAQAVKYCLKLLEAGRT
jgi:succinyl-CoA synthetase alpha subunit